MSTAQGLSDDAKLREMAVDTKKFSTGGGEDIDALLNWNNLTYRMPITNSVVSSRNHKQFRADLSSYSLASSNVKSNLVVQTGLEYVDWRNSTLNFTIDATSTGGGTWAWGHGSAFNILKEITILSRSGAELTRFRVANLYRVMQDRTTQSKDWFRSIGYLMGYREQSVGFTSGTSPAFDSHHFAIPCCLLTGLFDSDQLMPATICSGMRLEFTFETTKFAAIGGVTDTIVDVPGLEFTVRNLRLELDTHNLNDAAIVSLNKTAVQNGLEFVYTQHYSQKDPLSGDSANIVVSKAVSRALEVATVRTPVRTDSLLQDNFIAGTDALPPAGSVEDSIQSYQFRLGHQYYPHQPATEPTEFYWSQLYSSGFAKKGVSLGPEDYRSLYHMTKQTFERSNLLKYSGLPINNSRTMAFDAEYSPLAAPTTTELHSFLTHVTVTRAFLNNIVQAI